MPPQAFCYPMGKTYYITCPRGASPGDIFYPKAPKQRKPACIFIPAVYSYHPLFDPCLTSFYLSQTFITNNTCYILWSSHGVKSTTTSSPNKGMASICKVEPSKVMVCSKGPFSWTQASSSPSAWGYIPSCSAVYPGISSSCMV